jgi:GntR family transcriptional repressor for pyruvate dehydrogenase complex
MSGRERYWANAPRRPVVARLQRVPRLFGTICYGAGVPPRALVSDHVFRTLLEALLAGRYAPGEKLPTQRALAADLCVTMGSLREALKRLEQMGLIDVRHGDAMRVRDWREHGGLDVIAHLLFRSGGLDQGVLGDVLEARRLMLRELAALAALRASAEQQRRLGELAVAFAGAPDAETAQGLDFAFVTELAEAADNVVFVLILNSIRALYFEHAAALGVAARPHELAPAYAEAAEAVARGDADRARAVVDALAERQRERVEEALGR